MTRRSIPIAIIAGVMAGIALLEPSDKTAAIPEELTYAVLALIVGGVGGIAGAAIARERRNAF